MCRICNYNQVHNLDRALLAGVTPASLQKKYPSFSLTELQHHHKHLLHKMALTQKSFHHIFYQGLFIKLHLVMEMVLAVVRSAKGGGDAKLFLQSTREFTRIISLMDKMAAKMHFDPEFIYCLMASPQWDLQEDALLPGAFQALSQTRQALKQQFFFTPCPEPEPPPEAAMSTPPASPGVNPEPRLDPSLVVPKVPPGKANSCEAPASPPYRRSEMQEQGQGTG